MTGATQIRAFLRAPGGTFSILMIAALAGTAIVAPMVLYDQATDLNLTEANLDPSRAHLLGTNELGQDLFARVLVATRLSLTLALQAAAIGMAIGITVGAGATMLPGRLRSVVLRTIDALIVFPGILVAIIVGAILTNGVTGAVVGVGIANSFAFMRVTSTLTMSVSGRDYIAASRVAGVRRPRLLFRYVLPNIADTLAVTSTVVISGSIVQVSALSYLGLGVQAPEFDWGSLLTDSLKSFFDSPAGTLGTVGAIAVSSISFGFAGEALARALNPLLWSSKRDVEGNPVAASDHIASIDPDGDASEYTQTRASIDEPVLEVANLSVSFLGSNAPVTIVRDVSFVLGRGERLGIVGESGSGKSMMAMAIADLVQYPGVVQGNIRLEGDALSDLSRTVKDKLLGTKLALVFQDPLSSFNPALRIGTQMTEAVLTHTSRSRSDATALAESRLHEVMLPVPSHQLRRYPHELSGGMRQRVMIAMALMNEPSLLIADEPTTALDVTAQAQIMDLIVQINAKHGTAVVLISHDLGLISQNCDRVLVVYSGRIVEELTSEQLATEPMHPYTRALVAAVPDGRKTDEPLASIPGQVPDYADLPTGCSYHPRCPLATDECRAAAPPLQEAHDGRRVACWVAMKESA